MQYHTYGEDVMPVDKPHRNTNEAPGKVDIPTRFIERNTIIKIIKLGIRYIFLQHLLCLSSLM